MLGQCQQQWLGERHAPLSCCSIQNEVRPPHSSAEALGAHQLAGVIYGGQSGSHGGHFPQMMRTGMHTLLEMR